MIDHYSVPVLSRLFNNFSNYYLVKDLDFSKSRVLFSVLNILDTDLKPPSNYKLIY